MRPLERKLVKILIPVALLPLLLLAFPFGAPPGYTGAPGEQTCFTAGCHDTGTSIVLRNSSDLALVFPGPRQYEPGVTQRLHVTLDDPAGFTFGFQLSARDAQNRQAGDLRAIAMADTLVQPHNGVQYLGHTHPLPSLSVDFDWTPPATNVGDVTFYIAADASDNNQGPGGDRIHLTKVTVPGTGPVQVLPAIHSVVHGATLEETAGFAPGTFATIKGTDLVNTTTDWSQSFVGGAAPTELGGARVVVNGKPAYISYVGRAEDLGTDEDQINFIFADDDARGMVDVHVETADATSNTVNIPFSDLAPSFFLWQNRYVTTMQVDYSAYVAPANLFGGPVNGLQFAPAASGDVIRMYGAGFGPTNPFVAAGHLPAGTEETASPVRVFFGNTEAEVIRAGLSSFAGVYEIVVKVPQLANGEYEVTAEIAGASTPSGQYIPINN